MAGGCGSGRTSISCAMMYCEPANIELDPPWGKNRPRSLLGRFSYQYHGPCSLRAKKFAQGGASDQLGLLGSLNDPSPASLSIAGRVFHAVMAAAFCSDGVPELK